MPTSTVFVPPSPIPIDFISTTRSAQKVSKITDIYDFGGFAYIFGDNCKWSDEIDFWLKGHLRCGSKDCILVKIFCTDFVSGVTLHSYFKWFLKQNSFQNVFTFHPFEIIFFLGGSLDVTRKSRNTFF